MLVLSRKKNERIVIGDDITIMVVKIQGGKVRLGFDVPKEIPVHREEVHEDIRCHGRRNLPSEDTPTRKHLLAVHAAVVAYLRQGGNSRRALCRCYDGECTACRLRDLVFQEKGD